MSISTGITNQGAMIMAAKLKDFDFTRPMVRPLPKAQFRTVVKVGEGSSKPTLALKQLMAGKILVKEKQ